jgi:GTP cyclohydrolase I
MRTDVQTAADATPDGTGRSLTESANGARAGAAVVLPDPGVSTAPLEIGDTVAAAAAAEMFSALGVDLNSEHRLATPQRFIRALREMLTPPRFDPTSFENADGYDEFVVVEAVPFFSLCEHHVLPFVGTATIAYLPGTRIVGLSKMAWVVQLFARQLQVQERMTGQIADWIGEHLQPRGVGVRLCAEHLCMSLRGARATGAVTTTTARRGALLDDPERRDEWLRLLAARPT